MKWSYGLTVAAAAIGILAAGIVAILLFNALWFRMGFGAALAIVVGALLYVAWRADRKAREARAGLDRI